MAGEMSSRAPCDRNQSCKKQLECRHMDSNKKSPHERALEIALEVHILRFSKGGEQWLNQLTIQLPLLAPEYEFVHRSSTIKCIGVPHRSRTGACTVDSTVEKFGRLETCGNHRV